MTNSGSLPTGKLQVCAPTLARSGFSVFVALLRTSVPCTVSSVEIPPPSGSSIRASRFWMETWPVTVVPPASKSSWIAVPLYDAAVAAVQIALLRRGAWAHG